MAERVFDRELQLMAKRANQRLVEMERRGMQEKSPAYEAGTAYLQSIGRRRFSETGKGTVREVERQKRALEKFLGYKTSTVTGYKEYRRNVIEGLKKAYPELEKEGFDFEALLDLYKELPKKKKNRLYESETYIVILEAYTRKNGETKREKKLSLEELAQEIQSSSSFKNALERVGLSFKDINQKILKDVSELGS